MTAPAPRLHTHRGAPRPHPTTLRHLDPAAHWPHCNEVRRWQKRLGRRGKGERDRLFAERRELARIHGEGVLR